MTTPRFDLVVLAASAGGVQAVGEVLAALPAGFPVPIAVVIHRPIGRRSHLAEIWGRHCALRVKEVDPGERMRPGTVYLARPERHLVLRPDRTFRCVDGRKVRHVRSSANPLLDSAAQVLGERLIAVVLTGSDADATDGVQAVRAGGGLVIAQDRATSQIFDMPQSAIDTGAVDYVLPLLQIGPALTSLAHDGRLPVAGAQR